MTIEEIVHGEAKNIEFKVMLPKDSEKYTKTVVAFANTQGGRLIIGIDDETHEVTGVESDSAFRIMDSIANAVSDSCTPQIVPDIELQTVDNRTVVVATVAPGPNRPYYLDSILASNAFVLLTSDYFPFSKTQCAVFKGTERTVFLDKREFTGAIYEQIESATEFVLRNIRLGARIEGLIRKENYELPVEAIREMIINAHCHRNLSDSSCVQVAVYDDRLEVTSPGGLYNGITYEEMMNGRSKLRNRAIAHVFNQMGLVESWGTGIKRIMGAAENYGLPTPQIQVFDDMFRVNLYRRPIAETWVSSYNDFVREGQSDFGYAYEKFGEDSKKVRRKFGESSEKNAVKLNGTQRKMLELILKNSRISAKALSEILSVSSRAVEKNMKILKDQGLLIRHGSPKSGYWEVIKEHTNP